MKKIEAQDYAPEKSKLLMDYIYQILSDTNKVNGLIKINSAKINNEWMCTYDIYVKEANFERHINTEITRQQENVLMEQILNDLPTYFLESENIGITHWQSIRGGIMGEMNFDGIIAINEIGSIIKINFGKSKYDFSEAIELYNSALDNYEKGNKTK